MKPKPIDQFVHIHKKSFFQRLSDQVRTGHSRYVSGSIPIERATSLSMKFQARFQTDIDKYAASRRRKSGQATSRLLMYLPAADADELFWILLQCPSAEPDSSERWRDALADRIVFTGYELVRLTKPQEKHPTWTWRYTKEREAELRDEIIRCIRSRQDRALEHLIHTIYRTPGFAGARTQVKKMADLIRKEWKTRRKSSDIMPAIPERLGYLQRVADHGIKLSKLLDSRSSGQSKIVGTRRVAKLRKPDHELRKSSSPAAAVTEQELLFPVISPELLDAGMEPSGVQHTPPET